MLRARSLRASLSICWVLGVARVARADEASTGDVLTAAYPRADWRVNPSALNDVAFMIQRIVISHAEASGEPQVFYPDARVQRTRAQAIALAHRLAKQAQQQPASFSTLAERYSDDSVTRRWGGRLGLTRATMLGGNVVDALDVLDVGQVSEPIDTPQGVQIIRRLPIPPDEVVSGQAIYIRHREIAAHVSSSSSRSRLEAEQFADQITGEAQLGADFDALFARYAEQEDRSHAGDTGLLHVHAATSDALLTYALSQVAVGGVVGPIETRWGFAVLKRTPVRCRALFGTVELVFRHRNSWPTRAPTTRTRAETMAEAEHVMEQLSHGAKPSNDVLLDVCRAHGCRVEPRSWFAGERPLVIESALRGLKLGELLAEPIEMRAGIHIVRRVRPEEPLLPALRFSTPHPKAKSYADLVRVAGGHYLAKLTWQSAQEFIEQSALEPETAQQFAAVIHSLADALASSHEGADRGTLFTSARMKMAAVLGISELERYDRFVDERLAFIQRHL